MRQVLQSIANGWKRGSPAARFRRRRADILLRALAPLPKPVRVLDLGGQPEFWRALDMPDLAGLLELTFLNTFRVDPAFPGAKSLVGDARQLDAIPNQTFDLAFSNSVIEHVGCFRDQLAMARECMRVAESFFVQTPARSFPIEPHFLLPGFQFLPQRWRAWLHASRDWGWWKKAGGFYEALAEVESIRLMTAGELRHAFPGCHLWREYWGPLVKSHVAMSRDLAIRAGLVGS